MVDAMKICIAVGLTPAYRRMGSRLFETIPPGCEIYRMWSDEYLACFARTYTSTIYHPVGTARMGPAWDPRSVVDPQLRVLGGITGLRIADGSVMPKVVSGNTNAPIIMIGERLADMIKGRRLPRFRPPMAGNYFGQLRRSANDAGNFTEDLLAAASENVPEMPTVKTDFKYVDRILRSVRSATHSSPNYAAKVAANLLQLRRSSNEQSKRTTSRLSRLTSSLSPSYKRLMNRLTSQPEPEAAESTVTWVPPVDSPHEERLNAGVLNRLINAGSKVNAGAQPPAGTLEQLKKLVRQVQNSLKDASSPLSSSMLGSSQFMQLNAHLQRMMCNQTYTDSEWTQIRHDLQTLMQRQNASEQLVH